MKKSGFVYVLSNPCFRYLKIGYTTNDPVDRCAQLSRMQAIPMPFKLEQQYYVRNPLEIERDIHNYFAKFKVGKEFYDVTLDKVHEYLNERVNYMTEFEYWQSRTKPVVEILEAREQASVR